MIDTKKAVAETQRWISSMVIGLNLCPFAKRVFDGGKIHYRVSSSETAEALLEDLASELKTLTSTSIEVIETSILIHPLALTDFFSFNDFLKRANRLIDEQALRGVIQLAHFHPDYQFAEHDSNAVENYTNRSPYPMLHLLREESITRVAWAPKDLSEIPARNIETLKTLGLAKILKKLT